jgi:hypothetical protein
MDNVNSQPTAPLPTRVKIRDLSSEERLKRSEAGQQTHPKLHAFLDQEQLRRKGEKAYQAAKLEIAQQINQENQERAQAKAMSADPQKQAAIDQMFAEARQKWPKPDPNDPLYQLVNSARNPSTPTPNSKVSSMTPKAS